MAEILDKSREWSERFGSTLRASAETQYPHLYKGAVGGIEHVISVDNGAYYMEMWRDSGDQYYATTGAAIKPLPGLAKGARLDEALDRFFTLMADAAVEKGKRPQRPKQGGQRRARPAKPKRGVRKNIVEKVDPEIGPSLSVGHGKPSNLSPESSVQKSLAIRLIKNVVALTGNQPGSGRVKPPKPPAPKTYRSQQGFSGRRMGSPTTPGASRSGMVRRGYPMGSQRSMPTTYRVTGPGGKRSKPIKLPTYARMRKGCSCASQEVAKAVRAVDKQKGWTKESRKEFWEKISKGEPGGHTACAERMRGKVRDPHAFCATAEHRATGHWPAEKAIRAAGPYTPTGGEGRPGKVPKKPKGMTEQERFRRGGASAKPIKPMHPGQRMGGSLESTGGW